MAIEGKLGPQVPAPCIPAGETETKKQVSRRNKDQAVATFNRHHNFINLAKGVTIEPLKGHLTTRKYTDLDDPIQSEDSTAFKRTYKT